MSEQNKKADGSTTQLMSKLLKSSAVEPFIESHVSALNIQPFHHQLRFLMAEKHVSTSLLQTLTHMDQSYCYMLQNGRRKPSREMVFRIALALKLSIEETNQLLNALEMRALYARDQRDAIIVFALIHSLTLDDVNDKISQFKLKLI